MKPINDTIVIEAINEDKVTESGIIIKENKQPNFIKGTVVKYGELIPEAWGNIEGLTIVFPFRSLTDIELKGKEYLVGKAKDAIMFV